MSSELFQMVGHALAPLELTKPSSDAGTLWTVFDLNDCGWCLHLQYVGYGDPDDDGNITIKRIVLNTGQREVDLTPADLDADTWFACEEQCRDDWRKSYEVQP